MGWIFSARRRSSVPSALARMHTSHRYFHHMDPHDPGANRWQYANAAADGLSIVRCSPSGPWPGRPSRIPVPAICVVRTTRCTARCLAFDAGCPRDLRTLHGGLGQRDSPVPHLSSRTHKSPQVSSRTTDPLVSTAADLVRWMFGDDRAAHDLLARSVAVAPLLVTRGRAPAGICRGYIYNSVGHRACRTFKRSR